MTDPSDIVERLLDVADLDARAGEPLGKACREAAAEIERLRAALAAEREECAKVAGHVEKLQRAINRAGALASQEASHEMIIEALSDIPR